MYDVCGGFEVIQAITCTYNLRPILNGILLPQMGAIRGKRIRCSSKKLETGNHMENRATFNGLLSYVAYDTNVHI